MDVTEVEQEAAYVVVQGGRLIDPGNDIDGMHDLHIVDGRVLSIVPPGSPVPCGAQVLEAGGAVVAPGFVDIHSHMSSPEDLAWQACDGVTTALEMEAGTLGRARSSDSRAVLNTGSTASWALARISVTTGHAISGGFDAFAASAGLGDWGRPLTVHEMDVMLGLLDRELTQGALGVGMLLGYAPAVSRAEVREVATLAESWNRPLVVHARYMSVSGASRSNSETGLKELIRLSAQVGVRVHVCHINSTMLGRLEAGLELIRKAQEQGLPITAEAYPYGCGCTIVGAPFLAPERLREVGTDVSRMRLAGGPPLTSEAALVAARREAPGRLALFEWVHEDDWQSRLLPFTRPGVVVASDAMPSVDVGGRRFTHPRSVASFATALRALQDHGRKALIDVIDRCSRLPAAVVGEPLRNKGHLGVGADADVVVFDPNAVRPRADMEQSAPSVGFRHVLVNGVQIVQDGEMLDRAVSGLQAIA